MQLPVVDIDIANATKTQVGNVMFYKNLLNCINYHCYIINDILFAVFAVYKLCIQIKLLIKLM